MSRNYGLTLARRKSVIFCWTMTHTHTHSLTYTKVFEKTDGNERSNSQQSWLSESRVFKVGKRNSWAVPYTESVAIRPNNSPSLLFHFLTFFHVYIHLFDSLFYGYCLFGVKRHTFLLRFLGDNYSSGLKRLCILGVFLSSKVRTQSHDFFIFVCILQNISKSNLIWSVLMRHNWLGLCAIGLIQIAFRIIDNQIA